MTMRHAKTMLAAAFAIAVAVMLPNAYIVWALIITLLLAALVLRARLRSRPADAGLTFDSYEEYRELRGEYRDCVAVPGVYVMYNEDRRLPYVGQSVNMDRRVTDHFRGRDRTGGGREAYLDHHAGDAFKIMFMDLESSPFADLNEMEAYYIARFDSVENGYNRTRGNARERRPETRPRRARASARDAAYWRHVANGR